MRIYGNKPLEGQEINLDTQKVARAEAKGKNTATGRPGLNDRIDISDKGKEVAELMATINQLSDVRTDKVRAIKEAIESGNYNIDTLKIARKILNEL